MKQLAIVVLFSLANFVFCGNNTTVKSCDEGILPAVKIMIGDTLCAESPCVVMAGLDVVLDMTFKSPKYLDSFRPQALATALGVDVNYPLFQNNACTANRAILNTICPVVEGEIVEYSYTMTIYDIFPEISLSLRFSLVDNSDDSSITCFIIDMEVKKK